MALALPLVELGVAAMGRGPRGAARRLPGALGVLRRGGPQLVAELLAPAATLLHARLRSELTRAPIAAFAAHGGAGPGTPGTALFALWQAAYHRYGQWHAMGGSGALTDALVARLRAWGGTVRCGADVRRIDAARGRVRAVELETGESVAADVVVTAIEPRTALLELLDPALDGAEGRALRAVRRSNAVQAVVHVAAQRLPAYPGARAGDWNGLQSFVASTDGLVRAFAAAEAGILPSPAPAYAFTPSALDEALVDGAGHTVYLACPAAPFAVDGGWEAAGERLAEDMLSQLERLAPGFRAGVRGVHVRTPARMATELRWPGAHPMHLDMTPDQLGPLRPTAALGAHRTPVEGLFVSGAGTAPAGGVSGLPGRGAARAVLRAHPPRR